MKKYFFLLFAIIATACASAPQPAPIAPNASGAAPAANAAPNRSVMVLAHRGGAGLAPENTLASFRHGLSLNADFVEMDAHLTKDGVVVIIHDDTIDRTTDGAGRINDFALADLQKFNAAAKYANGTTDRQMIPTFAQVLDTVKPTQARIEVEIKVPTWGRDAGIEQKMLDEISARQMLDRVQISSFDFNVLKDLKRLNSQMKTVALVTSDFYRANDVSQSAKMAEQIQGLGAEFFASNKDFLSAVLVQEMHNRKIQVEAWTVDSDTEMKKIIAMGVDGIITNRPDTLNRVLGR